MSGIANAIMEARQARRILAPLGAITPADEAAGYAAQYEVAKLLSATNPAGFKIGATTRQMQEYLGLSGPAAGFVPKQSVQPNGVRLRFAEFHNPGVECEIGVKLGRDLPPGPCTPEQAGAAVAEVFAAIEVVERRYDDLKTLGTPTLIADQVFHRAGVVGSGLAAAEAPDLGAVHGAMFLNGEQAGEGHGRDLLGHPFNALAWLAGSGAARVFGGLKAGQLVWLGSVTPPFWLSGPTRVEARFQGLGSAMLEFV
jgi:2-keto-4-pentenoate hydratase